MWNFLKLNYTNIYYRIYIKLKKHTLKATNAEYSSNSINLDLKMLKYIKLYTIKKYSLCFYIEILKK